MQTIYLVRDTAIVHGTSTLESGTPGSLRRCLGSPPSLNRETLSAISGRLGPDRTKLGPLVGKYRFSHYLSNLGVSCRSSRLNLFPLQQDCRQAFQRIYFCPKKCRTCALLCEIQSCPNFIEQTLRRRPQNQSQRHVLEIHKLDVAL